jgi:hypothetical protein
VGRRREVKVNITLTVELEHESDLSLLIKDVTDAVERRDEWTLIPPVPFERLTPFRVIEGGKE